MIGVSPSFKAALQLAKNAASTSASACLLGESGTGKELFAKFIHLESPRAQRNFVAVNCGALPPSMIESLLFGHERGAFTGAIERQIGFLEQAHQGTLFLDEIAELPLELQTRLLRVLEDGQVQRLGARQSIAVDFRLITATHQNFPNLVTQGRFREDLLYRIYVLPIFLPPLRNRLEDIQELCEYFLQYLNHEQKITLSPEALQALREYSWPGNIRELKHTLQRASIICKNYYIERADLHFLHMKKEYGGNLQELQREHMLQTLQKYRGNHSQTARELGIARTTLLSRMKKYGILKEEI